MGPLTGELVQVRTALQGTTLSGLINNAGVAWPAPLLHQPISDFQSQINANLIGTVMVTQVCAGHLCSGSDWLPFFLCLCVPLLEQADTKH